MILMHIMFIPQKGRNFCNTSTFDTCISRGVSFFSAEVVLDGIFLLFLIYKFFFIKITILETKQRGHFHVTFSAEGFLNGHLDGSALQFLIGNASICQGPAAKPTHLFLKLPLLSKQI